MDTENKSIIKNTNIPLLITGVIAAIAACIFTAVTYPLMYDIHETAARILMILPPVFCAIFSLILYKNGSSAVTRELSALVFATGIAASVLLFKAFCGDNEMFYYSYGALPYLFPLAALAVLIIFDCIVPFVIYDSLVIVYCTTVFVSEYTTLLIPAALIALIPAYCYAIIKSGKNDYRKYLTRILLAAAILLAVFAYIELSVTVPVAVAVIVAAIFVFKKFKIEKTDFTIGIKQTLTAAVCSVCILSVILGFQIYYSYHLDRIRSQSVRADYEIEKLEIDKDKISVTLKAEKPNENNQYSGEKYALIRPNDDDYEKFYI